MPRGRTWIPNGECDLVRELTRHGIRRVLESVELIKPGGRDVLILKREREGPEPVDTHRNRNAAALLGLAWPRRRSARSRGTATVAAAGGHDRGEGCDQTLFYSGSFIDEKPIFYDHDDPLVDDPLCAAVQLRLILFVEPVLINVPVQFPATDSVVVVVVGEVEVVPHADAPTAETTAKTRDKRTRRIMRSSSETRGFTVTFRARV